FIPPTNANNVCDTTSEDGSLGTGEDGGRIANWRFSPNPGPVPTFPIGGTRHHLLSDYNPNAVLSPNGVILRVEWAQEG
ncbi:hypothetical protein PMAYCL1PPCAC_11459, partial [Pristionchus mayeri]